MRKRRLEKEASENQKAQHEYQGVNYDFDKTHEIFYPQGSLNAQRAKKQFSSELFSMSKPCRTFVLNLVVLVVVGVSNVGAQDLDATIKIDFRNGTTVQVEGSFNSSASVPGRRNLSFLTSVGGVGGLGDRVSQVQLFDSAGILVAFRKLAEGEYLSEGLFERWSYRLDLSPRSVRSASAHVSWSAETSGIIMLADILPLVGKAPTTARIRFADVGPSFLSEPVPIYSSSVKTKEGYEVSDVEDAVFYVGYYWERAITPKGFRHLIIAGSWNFEPSDLSAAAAEVHDFYQKLLGSNRLERPIVAISKFPKPIGFGHWEAETRGSNVTIISSDMPFRTQSLQRLHEQLRHELFHLWIPNGVNLTGNYDWFYEGFALYESLKLAVALNRIRFEDLLDTLSRAHTIDGAQSQRISLITASNTRFAGSNTLVYSRGMLVAFLCDLALLEQSKGKRSVENVLAQLFEKHRKPAQAMDGNAAVLSLLRADPQVVHIVDRYVTGTDKMDWTENLARAGIEDNDAGPVTTLRVKEKLNGRQKALLDKLGYNSWRKLTITSK